MHRTKLETILSVTLVFLFAAGCGSTKTAVVTGPEEDPARQAIIAEHEALAAEKRQELQLGQEEELENALSVINNEELDAIALAKDQLTSDLETAKEDAQATLADEELDTRIQELETQFQTDLAEKTAEIKAEYEKKRTSRLEEYSQLHEKELEDLNAQLRSELDGKLAEYDLQKSQAVQAAVAEKSEEPTPAPRQPEAPQPGKTPVVVAPAPATPAPGTRAPVEPVVTIREPQITDKGLRREVEAPLGQRRHYVNEYFRSGEVMQEINKTEILQDREHHEAVLTFWMEGTGRAATPRFALNGVPVATWGELQSRLESFRKKLIEEKHLLYAKVILDQRKAVPRSVVDDILSVCFKAGIRDISMGTTEPRMEQ